MATKTKKLKGSFEFILAIDFETTGLCFSGDIDAGHQAVSAGLIVADASTFKPIEELYCEIKWNEQSKATRKLDPNFGVKAEGIHGLTFDYLEKNGITEEEAVTKILNLIIKYWGVKNAPRLLGHNVHLFDYKFLICCRMEGFCT